MLPIVGNWYENNLQNIGKIWVFLRKIKTGSRKCNLRVTLFLIDCLDYLQSKYIYILEHPSFLYYKKGFQHYKKNITEA